ncbi:MAG: ABC transporter permease [Ruminococcaceae bacterium]|jgi:putative ABC transport system permease protein|nr:ABC transporter permease [Oscillospiraceae bacterium]
MGRVWGRRTLRELRAHFLRYLALGLMILLSMYLIVSLIGAADTVILGGAEHAEANRIEDGQFTVFVPLTGAEEDLLRQGGIDVEPMFYRDYALDDGSILRVFRIREGIDLAETETGAAPADDTEILLEKRYCETKSLSVGDSITAGGIELTVSGSATTPDYDAPYRSMGDSTVDSANFGTAFVTGGLYDRLAETGKSLQSEEYLYAYRLNGKLTDDELKEYLKTFSFDPDAVDDPVFQAYWKQIYGKRDDLKNGADELAEGIGELSEAIAGLSDRMQADIPDSLRTMMPDELFDGLDALRKAGEEAAEGSGELRDAVWELLDKVWSGDTENLRSFVTAADNPRIGASADDVIINKYASVLAGIIILALMAYVISVFVVHGIEEEQSVIGTLYALGVRRGELLRHYLVLPSLVCLAAGAVGTAVGYSRFGVPLQTADTYAYYSVPTLDTVTELWVILYGIVMPPLTAVLVNWIVIRRRLSAPALAMIRGEEKRRDVSRAELGNMSYVRRFRLRQMLREGRSAAGVVLGIFVCLLLMMIGINAYTLCVHVGQDNVADTKYAYMYLYKYPEEEVPEGGIPAYAESLKKEIFGYHMDVTVLGLERDNPFFDADPPDSMTRVEISSAMAQKYGLKAGDSFTVEDPDSDRSYAFTADRIVTYAPSFCVFMDIDRMRELFGAGEDYYNAVFSDRDLGIDPGRLYSVSTREDVVKAADVFVNLMAGMVYTMIIASSAIMAVVMYLMMKVMIDRSAGGIALFKVFGYRQGELSKLFIDGNTVLIAAGTLAAIPLSKILMDAVYPYLVSNVACSIDLRFPFWVYAALFCGVMLLYAGINRLLVRRIDRIDMGVVLKNRE